MESVELCINAAIMLFCCGLATGMFFVKRNPLYGFRTKKSMSSDYVWKKSNKFSAQMMIAACVAGLAVLLIFRQHWCIFFFCGTLLLSQIPVLMYTNKIYEQELRLKQINVEQGAFDVKTPTPLESSRITKYKSPQKY